MHLNNVVLLFAGRPGAIMLVKDGLLDSSKEQVRLLIIEVAPAVFEHPKPVLRCIPFFFERFSIPTLL